MIISLSAFAHQHCLLLLLFLPLYTACQCVQDSGWHNPPGFDRSCFQRNASEWYGGVQLIPRDLGLDSGAMAAAAGAATHSHHAFIMSMC
jgi:hypothetical protein